MSTPDCGYVPAPRRLLRCDACGRSEECSAAVLLRYTREGWPRCCGAVMAVFTELSHPASPAPPPTNG